MDRRKAALFTQVQRRSLAYDRALAWALLLAMPLWAFWQFFHVQILDPTNMSWLMYHDWGQHFLGWMAYRAEEWSFPLTRTDAFFTGEGAYVSLMDANPLLSTLLKPLSPLLPDTFQFIGPWILLCIVLQGVWAYVLLKPYTPRASVAALGGGVFIAWPALFFRLDHDTLMAQWLILAALWAFLTPKPGLRAGRFTLVFGLAAWVHPHLLLMAAAIWGASVLREGWLWLTRSRAVRALAGLVGRSLAPPSFAAVLLYAIGVIPTFEAAAWGFGRFSMNLNAPINPLYEAYARLLPVLPHEHYQYEGYQYFGVGLLLMCGFAVGFAVVARVWPGAPPLFLPRTSFARAANGDTNEEERTDTERPSLAWLIPSCVVATLIALSTTVRLGDWVLVDIALSTHTREVTLATLRASGRFFWPVAFVILFLAARTVIARPARIAAPILVGVLAVQAYDLGPLAQSLKHRTATAQSREFHVAKSPEWQELMAQAEHVVFIPARPMQDRRPYYEIIWWAIQADTPINVMYMSRTSPEQNGVARQSDAAFRGGVRDPAALYVLTAPCGVPTRPGDRRVVLDGLTLIAPPALDSRLVHLPRAPAC